MTWLQIEDLQQDGSFVARKASEHRSRRRDARLLDICMMM